MLFFWCFSNLAGGVPAHGGERLEVLTSFPPEFYTPFVKAFSRTYPGIQVSILNKKTTSALKEIKRGNPRRFDLFWSSSPDAFSLLKSGGFLKAFSKGRKDPALGVTGVDLDDPDGFFLGFALSGVGWMWNPSVLKREGLKVPSCWQDLTLPEYYGHLAMSTPSRSGTTHLIVESLLQQMGWKRGWAFFLEMAGNLKTVSARSFSVPEGVIRGRYAAGLGIDFLARSRPELGFRYGEPVSLSAAGIALLKGGENQRAASLFVDFLLSPKGQSLLLLPEVSRMPVSKCLHDEKRVEGELAHLIEKGEVRAYNAGLSQSRYHLVNSLFYEMITYRLPERRKVRRRLLSLEREARSQGLSVWSVGQEVRELLNEVPVTEEESRTPSYT